MHDSVSSSLPDDQQLAAEFRAVRETAAVVELPQQTVIAVSGGDAVKWLNNFCTADVKGLAVGNGGEAFVLNAKGKIVGHVLIRRVESGLELSTVPREAEKLTSHLGRYIIREDVVLEDQSSSFATFVLSGPQAVSLLLSIASDLEHSMTEPLGRWPLYKNAQANAGIQPGSPTQAMIQRVAVASPVDWALRVAAQDAQLMRQILQQAGAVFIDPRTWEMARIKYGFPLMGIDITENNLPQEVQRDHLAISFNKGCYLGQETVARIDALGHVNKFLVSLAIEASSRADTSLGPVEIREVAGGKAIGQITSWARVPASDEYVGLGYVRRGWHEPGTKLTSTLGNITVVATPSSARSLSSTT